MRCCNCIGKYAATWLFLALLVLCLVTDGAVIIGAENPEKTVLPFAVRQARATAHLSNDVLDLYFTERYSDTWRFMYKPEEWGESCYYEHYAVWTPARGIIESDTFQVISPFGSPIDGTIAAVLKAGPFEITREILLEPNTANRFTIHYTIKNTGTSTEQDVRFFQTIDFDIPVTADCTDDYGHYDSDSHDIWVVDYEYFRDRVDSVPDPSAFGLNYWYTEIYDDWDDGQLNQRSYYGPGDPAIGLQWNLGDLSPGEQAEVIVYIIFDYEAAADLSVKKVEINQAFQDRDVTDPDMIPLVAEKPLVFRVFVDIGNVEGPVNNMTGLLHIFKNGQEIPGSPFTPDSQEIDAPKNPSRQVTNDTLNFYPPALGTGDYTAYVELDPYNIIYEANEDNNRYDFSFGVTSRRPVRLIYYQIYQEGYWPSETRVAQAYTWMEKTYPTPYIAYISKSYLDQTWGGDIDFSPWTRIALASLAMRLGLYNLTNDPDADVVIGWLPEEAADGDWAGITDPILHSAFVYDFAWQYEADLAHEVGHNFGLHVNCEQYYTDCSSSCSTPPSDDDYDCACNGCPIGEGGFDPVQRRVIPDNYVNFMDAGSTNSKWVWRPTYLHLYEELDPTRQLVRKTPQEYIVISGTIDHGNNVTFDNFYRLAGVTTPTEFTGGPYALEFLDAAGDMLASYSFAPDFRILGIEEELDVAPFVFIVSYPEGTEYIRIVYQAVAMNAKQILNQVEVSPHAPTVTVIYPSGGEMLSGTVNVTWTAEDDDGDQLTYAVLYSNDGGESWQVLAEGLQETSFELDTTALPGGNNCFIKVLATDGVNTSEDISDGPFSVGKKPPEAFIASPEDGATVRAGQTVVFEGVGFDLEDGVLQDPKLVWTSDLDGQLGTGSTLATQLSEGEHIITLTVTDSDGNTAQASIRVNTVQDTTPPSPPTNLTAVQGDTCIRLTWLPSPEDDVGGYILHLGESSGQYYLGQDIGNVTEYLLESLVVERTYYIALSAYDLVGNESGLSQEIQVTIEDACTTQSAQLATEGWHMMTLPGELCGTCAEGGSGDLVCALSDDLDPCYIFHYDPAVGGYVMAPPAENINYHAGMGFWVRTYEDNVPVDAEVQMPAEAVEVPLGNGWNQIGNPFTFAIAANALRVRYGDTELSLIDAQAQGWVSVYLFGYDTASGGYVMIDPTTGCLQSWNGYWMRSYRDDCVLIVPPTECSSSAPAGHALSVKELQARGLELPPSPPTFTPISEAILDELVVRNVPNPIRSQHTTTFKVEGKGADLVQAIRVEIYDLAGQRVFTQDINAKELEWHTVNDTGELLANGVYLYQVWVKLGGEWYPTGIKKLAVVR